MKKTLFTIMAVGLMAGASAFTATSKSSSAPAKRELHRFQFTGTSTSQALNAGNWIELDMEEDAPGCASGSLPCYVETDQSIQQWLSNKNQSTVVSAASARRN